MATPKKGLFRKLRNALSIRKAARVAPAISIAAQLDEAVGIEGIDAVRQATNVDGEDAAAVKRWARRLAQQTRRKETVDEDDDVVERLQSSPTHFGRSLSEATDDLVTVSPDRETQLPSKRYEVPDLHLGRLGTQKPGLMSPLPRFSARLTNRTARASARTPSARDGSTYRLQTARLRAEVKSESHFAAFAALENEEAPLPCLEDDHWVRRVCVTRLPDESVEVLRATCAALSGNDDDDAAFAFEAFCGAVSNRSSTTEAVALSKRCRVDVRDRLQDAEEGDKALLCAFLKDAQVASTILKKGKGRRSMHSCRAALELVQQVDDEETAQAVVRHVDACLNDEDHTAMMALLCLRRLLEGGSPILIRYALKPNKSLLSFASERLDHGSTEAALVALRTATYALVRGRDEDVRHLASTLVPLHTEALKSSFERCHLEALLVVAARCDFTDVVDAFRYCEVLPLLVKRLNASTERSQPESPLKPIAKFSVNDTVLALGEAKNGKERWFRASVERVGTHSYDVRWASSGSVEAVPKEKVRAPGTRREPSLVVPLQRPKPSRSPRLTTSLDEPWCLDVEPLITTKRSHTDLSIDISAARRSHDGESESLSSIVGHIPQTPNVQRDSDVPSIIEDDATHDLVLTLLLVLSVGRASDGGELEPAFCTSTPLMETGTTLTLKRSSSNLSATALQMLKPSEGNATGRRTLTARSLSARSALLSARSTPDDLSASIRSGKGLLDVGTEGDSLRFHVLDCLHQHLNDPKRSAHVDRVLPSVVRRLEAWGAAMASSGRSHGASRLLRLLHENATPVIRKALVAEQRGAFIGRGRFGGVVGVDDGTCAKILRRERSNRDRSVCHAVYGEVSALWLLKGTGSAPELLDFGLSRDCYVLVMERCSTTLLNWRFDKVLNDDLVRDVARIFSKCCRAVEAMHMKRILHLDIKSENVLIKNDEDVCLGDFGEARALGERDGVRLSKAHGTECVQAPEVLSGVQQGFDASVKVTTKADCWALGCLWYELLTGNKLFEEMACNDWPRFFVLLTGDGELPPADLVGVFAGLAKREAILGVFRHAFMRDASKRATARELAELADNCAM